MSLFSLLFFFLLLMSLSLSWIKQQDLAVVILYKTFLRLEPLFRGHPWGREGKCPPGGGRGRGVGGTPGNSWSGCAARFF